MTKAKTNSVSKKGQITPREEQYVKANMAAISAKEMSRVMGRPVETVQTLIDSYNDKRPTEPGDLKKIVLRQGLESSERWQRIKMEFTGQELKFFREAYVEFMGQFEDDIVATEESQIFDAIKLDVLKSRNLIERKRAREDIARLSEAQDKILSDYDGDYAKMMRSDGEVVTNLESQLAIARAAETSKTTEYAKLQERYDKILHGLKAIRDQRVKETTNVSKDWIGVIKNLARKDVQEKEGRQMELAKLAGLRAHENLGKVHTYEDGNADNPILSEETLAAEEERQSSEREE